MSGRTVNTFCSSPPDKFPEIVPPVPAPDPPDPIIETVPDDNDDVDPPLVETVSDDDDEDDVSFAWIEDIYIICVQFCKESMMEDDRQVNIRIILYMPILC